MELVQMLTSQLGVTQQQAQGGSGLIFQMAQEKLGAGEFSQLASAVPGIENLISAAPAPQTGGIAGALGGLAGSMGGGLGQLGGLAGSMGGNLGQLGALASLAGGFQKLGLDPNMVSKFAPIVMSFVQSKGGDSALGILQKALQK